MYFATAKEMQFLDKIAVENGLCVMQMMELAGWHMLPLITSMSISKKSHIVVVCGTGNKGGNGLCAARHLLNHGFRTSIILMSKNITTQAKHHLDLLQKIDANILTVKNLEKQDEIEKLINSSTLIIDALIGYNLKGAPRDNFAKIIEMINKTKKNVICYDIPTGIDPTTGECFEPHIRAYATLSLALPKKAFTKNKAKSKSGKIFIADIGIPHFLYERVSPNSRPNFGQVKTFFAPI
ncbi:MAG: NAD(P)H-hydrate epimerase [Candidatus Magasanikbacteria bacterium]|nr:NAD(P)H-hydrate epimerase [Candidatus Magasanikbacteria bacterium]